MGCPHLIWDQSEASARVLARRVLVVTTRPVRMPAPGAITEGKKRGQQVRRHDQVDRQESPQEQTDEEQHSAGKAKETGDHQASQHLNNVGSHCEMTTAEASWTE